MRPATIASLEVDGLKPARLLVVALLTFVLIMSASVAPAAGRVALVGANSSYAYMPPPAAGFGATVATAAQDSSAVEAELGLDRPTRRLIQQGLRNEGFDPGVPDGLFGPRARGRRSGPGKRRTSRPRRGISTACRPRRYERRPHRQ